MSRILLAASIASAVSAVTVKLGMDTDYPPYAFRNANGGLDGFGKDVADGMTASTEGACADLTIEVVYAKWSDCWTSNGGGAIGRGIENGTYDGCMTYTHTRGIRDELADFSIGILDMQKGAGLMTLLDNGIPRITGADNLKGKKIVDVGGWAPTMDTIAFVENKCTGELYHANLDIYVPSQDGNDAAMAELMHGRADAMYLYSDQAHTYTSGCSDAQVAAEWNCTLWEGLGSRYAYVQSGQFGYQVNGTTLALTKKGSGVPERLNPCLAEFMRTREYFDVCAKYDHILNCYVNSHFPAGSPPVETYNKPTNQLTGDCSTGYCPCPGGDGSSGQDATNGTSTAADHGSRSAPCAAASLAALTAVLLAA